MQATIARLDQTLQDKTRQLQAITLLPDLHHKLYAQQALIAVQMERHHASHVIQANTVKIWV
jgi:hypothetical protein